QFNVITKLPVCDVNKVENIVNSSLNRLNTDSVYGYLIHNVKAVKKNNDVFYELQKIKEKGLIKKIGFSLYNTSELETLFANKIDFNIIQVPYNLFDQRFESYFKLLKEKNIELHIRSVFLQGLFFIKPEKLDSEFLPVKEKIKLLNDVSMKSGIPIQVLCLSFVLRNSFVDKVVIGIDGNEHLLDLLSMEQKISEAFSYYDELKSLKEDNPNIILPYKWGKSE
ncbi:MAG: aldo/keto reductase, partial [Ignavibacteria bacterium]